MRKNNTFIYTGLLMLVALVLVLIAGIFFPTKSGQGKNQTSPAIGQDKDIHFEPSSYHLQDNNALYEAEERTKVETMYLTVGRGNDADNTNHTWGEINGHSAYYYERKNIARYKIAGLLQVGNEKGPQVGQLGYGEMLPNATVQIRGQTSSRNVQKNYKIELKKNKGLWHEQRTINLNKHQTDGLRFRNKLSYTLLEDIPQLLSMRTHFVHLYVKDTTGNNPNTFVDYGLYTQVEQLNKDGMRAHNLDVTGHLYKVNFFEFLDPNHNIRLETDKKFNKKSFEKMLEIKGSTDHQKLIDLIKIVNDHSQDFDKVLDKYFDVENLSYWMAFQILVGNRDTQNRNMYLYSPLNSERWYIIPWDQDASFYDKEYQVEKTIGNASWEKGISNYWGNMLFKRSLKSEKFRFLLDEAVRDLKENQLKKENITKISKQLAKTVSPYVFKMPDSTYLGFTPAQYQEIFSALPNEVENNYKLYKESLTKPMPFFITVPEVKQNKLVLSWDSAFDFGLKDITYTVEVGRSHDFTKPIFKAENLKITSAEMPFPKATGQYFIRVRARNEAGKTQDALDYYVVDNNKISGVKSFFVQPDQKIVEEVYEEK